MMQMILPFSLDLWRCQIKHGKVSHLNVAWTVLTHSCTSTVCQPRELRNYFRIKVNLALIRAVYFLRVTSKGSNGNRQRPSRDVKYNGNQRGLKACVLKTTTIRCFNIRNQSVNRTCLKNNQSPPVCDHLLPSQTAERQQGS